MENNIIFIEVNRDGYSPEQCGYTLTVGKLIEILNKYDNDSPIYLKNYDGCTYGSITDYDIYKNNFQE